MSQNGKTHFKNLAANAVSACQSCEFIFINGMISKIEHFAKNEVFHLRFFQLMRPNPQETGNLVTLT